jgi:hypothetical protein
VPAKRTAIARYRGRVIPRIWISTRNPSAKRPICVMGMGRSGTSLTTALIGLLGVDLGPTERMLEAVEHDNARGYWEQREIYGINKEILATFGGSWEMPPDLPSGWEHSPALSETRERASRLLADLFGTCDGRWAWKDPRASVTLPFWRQLIGKMDYVLCVRHPADVAASLAKRGGENSDFDGSIALWLHYVQAALHNTRRSRRLILLYEDYFVDTERQIRRLSEFVCGQGAPPSEEVRERVESFIEPGLWHNRDVGDGLARVRAASPEVADLYTSLLASRSLRTVDIHRRLRRMLGLRYATH